MRTLVLLGSVLRPLAIGLATLAKVIVVFHWTTVRDIATAVGEELRIARYSEPDDWER